MSHWIPSWLVGLVAVLAFGLSAGEVSAQCQRGMANGGSLPRMNALQSQSGMLQVQARQRMQLAQMQVQQLQLQQLQLQQLQLLQLQQQALLQGGPQGLQHFNAQIQQRWLLGQ